MRLSTSICRRRGTMGCEAHRVGRRCATLLSCCCTCGCLMCSWRSRAYQRCQVSKFEVAVAARQVWLIPAQPPHWHPLRICLHWQAAQAAQATRREGKCAVVGQSPPAGGARQSQVLQDADRPSGRQAGGAVTWMAARLRASHSRRLPSWLSAPCSTNLKPPRCQSGGGRREASCTCRHGT